MKLMNGIQETTTGSGWQLSARSHRPFGGNPLSTQRFRLAVVLAALMLAALSLHSSWAVACDARLLFCLALAVASEAWPLVLPRYGATTLSDAMTYAILLLYGPAACLISVLGSCLMRFTRERRLGNPTDFAFVAYSLSQTVVSYGTAALFYNGFSRRPTLLVGSAGLIDVALFGLAALAGFLMQTVIVGTHQWLDQDRVGALSTRLNWSRIRLSMQALAPLGLLQAVALQQSFVAGVTLVGPIVVTYLTIRNYTETLREAQEVLGTLADAVEKREPHTVGHTSRVARISTDIARELRLSEAEVRSVARAARLHELGKISLADHILVNGGTLHASDWEQVRRYPEVGAKVVSVLSLSRREGEIIRYHQECFNGKGYPHGLKSSEIPIGSRILCVAKAFDAMISWRSYRQPLSMTVALSGLVDGCGVKFDPQVVDALSRLLARRQPQVRLAA
jgi:HD-GYP domain-containing protein (c-di-GMP phosphodiesterase class II)